MRTLSFRVRCGLGLALLAWAAPWSAQTTYDAVDEQLGRMIAAALVHHPQPQALEARAAERDAQAAVHGGLPEAMLNYRWFGAGPETRVGPQRHGIELRQPIDWPGARRQAESVDRHHAEADRLQAAAFRRQLIADVKRSYFELAHLQEALAVNTEERVLMERYEQIALDRYANGQGNQQSVVKAQTEVSRLDERRLALQQSERQQLERLRYLTGESVNITSIRLRPFPARDKPGTTEPLPEQQAFDAQRSAQQARIEQLQIERKPDFTVGLGWIEVGDREDLAGITNPPPDNGQDVFSLMLGVKLPTQRARTQRKIDAVEAGERAIEARRNAFEQERDYRLQDAWTRWSSLGERFDVYREAIVPQASRTLASADAAYATGRLPFLDLLDAQRVTFQARLAMHRLWVDRWIAAAEIERWSGQPFPAGEMR